MNNLVDNARARLEENTTVTASKIAACRTCGGRYTACHRAPLPREIRGGHTKDGWHCGYNTLPFTLRLQLHLLQPQLRIYSSVGVGPALPVHHQRCATLRGL